LYFPRQRRHEAGARTWQNNLGARTFSPFQSKPERFLQPLDSFARAVLCSTLALVGGIVQGEGEGGESHGRAAWRSEADKSIARCSASPRKIDVRRCAALGAALRPVSISEGHSVFTNPMSWLRMIAVVLLVVGIPAAEAAPLVPSSDLPGRERYRFTPSPLDRFMQPNPPARPLLQWDCGPRGGWWGKARSRRTRPC
jgi:hypothetical protein